MIPFCWPVSLSCARYFIICHKNGFVWVTASVTVCDLLTDAATEQGEESESSSLSESVVGENKEQIEGNIGSEGTKLMQSISYHLDFCVIVSASLFSLHFLILIFFFRVPSLPLAMT